MRPLEVLLCLSFFPALLLAFFPYLCRRQWLVVATLLPMLAAVLHLGIEGWRTQMVPFYILALLVMTTPGVMQSRHVSMIRRRHTVLAGAGVALFLLLGAVLADWVLPVITLPKPTGPYHVGIIDRELIDKTRGRRLMVSVWYPAASGGPLAPLTHHPDEVMKGLANLTGLPAPLFQHLRYVTLSASEGVPVQATNMPFPVLVFSHGLVGLRLQNSSTLQELASWGYVVVAIDHTDAASVTVFPDGEARYYNLERFGIPSNVESDKALMNEHVFPVWVADQRFVYDMLEMWDKNDPLFAGKLDLDHIGSFGHSFGGATALEVCRIDVRCQTSVDLDGGLYGESVTKPAVRPLLLMSSSDSNRYPSTITKWQYLVAHAGAGAYWLELPHSTHLSFTFSQLLSPLLVPHGYEPHRGLQIVDKYLLAFFDTYLRRSSRHPLASQPSNTDVIWHTK